MQEEGYGKGCVLSSLFLSGFLFGMMLTSSKKDLKLTYSSICSLMNKTEEPSSIIQVSFSHVT